MPEFKSKRKLNRFRTVRSITQSVQPIVSKYLIDFQTNEGHTPNMKTKAPWQPNSDRLVDTVLDRIISKLKGEYKAQDILLMITPASNHVNLYKLHAIHRHRQDHLGVTTITLPELSRLKVSKAFRKYCIVFGSRYIDLKNVVLHTETIKSLVDSVNKKCCGESNQTLASPNNSLFTSKSDKSDASSAGDYIKDETVKVLKYQDCVIQTDPEITDNVTFSLKDIYTLIETINTTLQPSKRDIERFFFIANKLNFVLVVRPEVLWTTANVCTTFANIEHFLLESYLPGNCYLGGITVLENDLLQALDSYPKLLFNIHAIEDVYEITPLPKRFVNILRKVLGFLKLELLYDALGELIFDWYKNFTFL